MGEVRGRYRGGQGRIDTAHADERLDPFHDHIDAVGSDDLSHRIPVSGDDALATMLGEVNPTEVTVAARSARQR